MRRFLSAFIVFSIIFVLLSQNARAEAYVKPSLAQIIKSLIRYGAIDIYNDDMIDIYGRTNECELYKKYYKDEFTWEQIRGKMRDVIRQEVVTYPTGYKYDTVLKLDRYDFQRKVYPFVKQEENSNVNVFAMVTNKGDFCTEDSVRDFPQSYRLVLDNPVRVPELPINEEEGAALFNRMNEVNNTSHLVFLRFNIRVVYIASLASTNAELSRQTDSVEGAKVRQRIDKSTIVLDSRLDNIEFYEDEARTKLIYIYRP